MRGMNNLNKTQIAWLAGLIEGEGCLYDGGTRSRASVSVNMTDRDVLVRIHEWFGMGNLYDKKQVPDHKPQWAWLVGSKSDVSEVITTIYPFLCERRRKKAEAILRRLESTAPNIATPSPDERIAWLTGILEGEGCFRIAKTKGWTTCNVKVSMTDRDTIERVQEWAGGGGVYSYAPSQPNRKRVWEWTLTKQDEVLPFVRKIRPLLCERRGREADAMIAALEEKQANGGMGRGRQHRVKAHCPKGHPYSGSNLMVNSHNGGRNCRICDAEAGRRWRSRNPERVREVRRAARKRYYAKNAARLRREALARYHARKTA